MPFGASFKNDQNTNVIGENIIPVMVSSLTNVVDCQSDESWKFYQPPRVDGHIPSFTMTSNIKQFYIHGDVGNDGSNYSVYSAERFVFDDNSDIGNLTFSYTALGDVVSYPSGGYGLEVRNDAGQVTFNSNSLLLSPDNIVSLNSGDTVTIANGKTVCPLAWYFYPSFQSAPVIGRIIRSGSTTTFTASRTSGTGWCCSLIVY